MQPPIAPTPSRNRARRLAGLAALVGALLAAGAGMPSLSPDAVQEAVSQPGGPLLLDVRSEREFATGRVPGARNIPYDELKGRLDEIAAYRDRGVITYCERGGRASVANQILRDAGFADVAHLQGDMSRWRAEGRPVETTAPAPAP